MKTAYVYPGPRADSNQLEMVVVEGTYPDLDAEWVGNCWKLQEVPGQDPNWRTHQACISHAGGLFEWDGRPSDFI